MTKDEIKKALRIHIDDDACCYDCPYFGVDDCNDELESDALALITEQEKEIERLKAKIIDCTINSDIEAYDGIINQAKIEGLERLKKRIRTSARKSVYAYSFIVERDIDEMIEEVKAE